jgi:hypothetical protein
MYVLLKAAAFTAYMLPVVRPLPKSEVVLLERLEQCAQFGLVFIHAILVCRQCVLALRLNLFCGCADNYVDVDAHLPACSVLIAC